MQEVKPTLLIIAAGMGSRYGGLKQIDPVGPNGEIIIDYSMYDAVGAGFKKIVFVIRRSFEEAFKEKIGSKLNGIIETDYAFQELDLETEGFSVAADRSKPWGTGHAILSAKNVINEPFAVINADDYYGAGSFKLMVDFLKGPVLSQHDYTMVGFILRNTLSEYGTVARGLCKCDQANVLSSIVETLGIKKQGNAASYIDESNNEHKLTGDEIASMNLWGFHPGVFEHLTEQFHDFLREHGMQLKSEFYIPTVVDNLIKAKAVKVHVLLTEDKWFGVTYKEDKALAQESIMKLIKSGVYKNRLWG